MLISVPSIIEDIVRNLRVENLGSFIIEQNCNSTIRFTYFDHKFRVSCSDHDNYLVEEVKGGLLECNTHITNSLENELMGKCFSMCLHFDIIMD